MYKCALRGNEDSPNPESRSQTQLEIDAWALQGEVGNNKVTCAKLR